MTHFFSFSLIPYREIVDKQIHYRNDGMRIIMRLSVDNYNYYSVKYKK